MTRKRNKQSSFYKNPIVIGSALIIIISGYFLFKSLSGEKKLEQLDKKLAREKEETNRFNIETVSPEEVFQSINDTEINLVDIRNSSEYNLKHIESSINIPFDNLKKDISKFSKDKKNIIIDKENTTEGQILVDHFQKEGLDISYLEGGILKYAQQNYPLVSSGNINNPTDLIKVTSISAEDVKKRLLNGQIFSFIDTRPEYLYTTDKIEGSFNFPLEKIEKKKEELPVHKLLLYDSDPLRSFKTSVKLYDMGITNFYNCTDNYDKLKEILFSKNKK
jgi:rhodanese-related sulfurtransferase